MEVLSAEQPSGVKQVLVMPDNLTRESSDMHLDKYQKAVENQKAQKKTQEFF